jgi:UDP-GlcNAc3NAcA epimerase
MKKIVTVVGARPQFIKAATISRINEIIVHTGQHFDRNMSEVFFEEMKIPVPKYNLSINQLTHGAMTGRMLEGIEKVCLDEKPDLILVYGDTNSTLAGALAAKKLNIPVAHVEAGLRSFNMTMPEEINRILTDRISDFLYCPSEAAINNLKREGFDNYPSKFILSGDVMYDAALFYHNLSHKIVKSAFTNDYNKGDFVLCTLHRQENTDNLNNLTSIIEAINEMSLKIRIVLPLHPRTAALVKKQNIKIKADVIEPLSYFQMLIMLENCSFVMTDSGGLQKEAYFFNKFCITFRQETEWTELVDLGVNFLTGPDHRKIVDAWHKIEAGRKIESQLKIYGDGKAAEQIVNHLLSGI